MKAAVAYALRDIQLVDVPRPDPGPGDVRLEVRAVGICGSDIHLFRGEHPYRVFPMIYGHEFTATVANVGPNVSGLEAGTLVVVEPLLACGACYPCRVGRYNCCTRLRVIGVHVNGGLADSVVVPAARVSGAARPCARRCDTVRAFFDWHACSRTGRNERRGSGCYSGRRANRPDGACDSEKPWRTGHRDRSARQPA